MEELAIYSDLYRAVVPEVPLKNFLVVLNCAILVSKVAERASNLRHVLVNILFAFGPIYIDISSR